MKVNNIVSLTKFNSENILFDTFSSNGGSEFDFKNILDLSIDKAFDDAKSKMQSQNDKISNMLEQTGKLASKLGLNLPKSLLVLDDKLEQKRDSFYLATKKIEQELKEQKRMFLNYELSSEMNKIFFSNYGINIKGKKRSNIFDGFNRINKIFKELKELG